MKKIYLKNDLKLGMSPENRFAGALRIAGYNEKLGKNFYDFINEYRVDEVKKRFADAKYDYMTTSIGFDSGFHSKRHFILPLNKYRCDPVRIKSSS